MPTQADIDALNALPLTDEARARAMRQLEARDSTAATDLTAAMHEAVAPAATVTTGRRNVTPAEIAAQDQAKESVAAFEAGEPGAGMKAPERGYSGGRVGAQSPVTQQAVADAAAPPAAEPVAAPAAPDSEAKAFDPYAPRSAGPRLPTTFGGQRQGPVQVTQDQFRTGIATPDEQLEGEQRIERMGQQEGEIAAAQQERAFEVAELDRGELERQRRAAEAQQIAEEEQFLLRLSEKEEEIDQLREKRSAVPRGERKIEGFWDNVAGWLAVLGGENGGKVIDEIANKEIVKYDRERALFDDEIRGQAEDFDRTLAAQPSRRAALELRKTVKFTQIARKLDQKLNEAESEEQKAAISLARDHAAARAQEARLKWRQAYGDVAVTQVSRTTAQPVTSSLITPTGIGQARQMSAQERFQQALAAQEQTEAGRQAVISGEAVPVTGPQEDTQPDKATRTALGLPDPKPAARAPNKPKFDPSGAPVAQLQKEKPPESKLSLEPQPGEDAAAHYDRIAQDPNVRRFLDVMARRYVDAGVPKDRAIWRALNDASGANWFGEASSGGEQSDLGRSFMWDGKRVFAPNRALSQDALAAKKGIALARDGIAEVQKYADNAGRFADADARAAATVSLRRFNTFIETLTPGGVLSPEEIKERKATLPDPSKVADIVGYNQGLIRAWSDLINTVNERLQEQVTLDPEGRFPLKSGTGYVQLE